MVGAGVVGRSRGKHSFTACQSCFHASSDNGGLRINKSHDTQNNGGLRINKSHDSQNMME